MIHKYFTPVLIALLCMYGGKISAKEISVQSPDGKLKVNIELKDKIYYSVYSGSDLLLSNCSLTMTLDNEVLGKQPKLKSLKRSKIEESVKREIPLKNAIVENHCNTLRMNMAGNYAIEFRIFDNGIAYRFLTDKKGEIMSEAKWYVVHTYSGYENKVKANIDKTIENRHLEDQILEVRVPLEEVTELRNGVEKAVQRKMFPGYVMIHMIMNDDTWYVVRNTRGVTGFVGPGSKPVPLDESEMENLGIKQDEVILDLEIGDVVTVLSGAWEGTVGAVQTINEQKKSLTINVELFGRETPVELELAQAEPIED